MVNFPTKKTKTWMINRRTHIFGIGINDADYVTEIKIDGRRIKCPFSVVWKNMIMRCYCDKYQKMNTTYIGCTVCEEWLLFSNFKAWMEQQDWIGKELDKDIIKFGNKVYSPETCCFISTKINCFLLDSAKNRGSYPIGVSWHKGANKFRSYCKNNGKVECLGNYLTADEASAAYYKRKNEIIYEIAMQQTDLRVRNGLLYRISKPYAKARNHNI